MLKLQIKTLNQKSLVVEIEESKTVYDLKRELAMYSDVGVEPELQKIIYAGKILTNADTLSACNIDTKKFLVVMILKQPLEEVPTSTAATAAASVPKEKPTTSTESKEVKTPETPKRKEPAVERVVDTVAAQAVSPSYAASETEALVSNIVSMGYAENEVRLALAASFNNPERAIEYLIEGIPNEVADPVVGGLDFSDENISPLEVFRGDPLFRNLRRAIQQHPELLNDAIQQIGEANPSILALINQNQEAFLSMLLEGSDDDDEEERANN